MKIVIISASVRAGRKSHRAALYFKNYIIGRELGEVEMLDLNEYQFPLFNERLKYQKNPAMETLQFVEEINSADGVIIVTPEYNGGYPASLKNVIDLLHEEWKRKPIAIVSVSDGPFGGSEVITSLVFSLWKIGSWVIPAMFPVSKVEDAFDEKGNAVEKEKTDKRAHKFIGELIWCIEAKGKMNAGQQ